MGQRVCTCCLKREVEYQELPRMIDTQRAPQPNPTTGLVAGVCVVCRDVAANTMCLPCGHLLICYRCSLRYALPDGSLHPDVRCPNCKVAVKSFQRVFLQTASTMTRCSHTPAWWSHEPAFIYVRELKRDLVAIFLEKPAFLWELDRAHGSNEIGPMYITLYWKVA